MSRATSLPTSMPNARPRTTGRRTASRPYSAHFRVARRPSAARTNTLWPHNVRSGGENRPRRTSCAASTPTARARTYNACIRTCPAAQQASSHSCAQDTSACAGSSRASESNLRRVASAATSRRRSSTTFCTVLGLYRLATHSVCAFRNRFLFHFSLTKPHPYPRYFDTYMPRTVFPRTTTTLLPFPRFPTQAPEAFTASSRASPQRRALLYRPLRVLTPAQPLYTAPERPIPIHTPSRYAPPACM